MIISASRRTDIPAFYSEWFANRIKEGLCRVPNPMNAKQMSTVSLRPEDVDAIVLWTRHAAPFFKVLPFLDERRFRYYFQYTVTGYGSPVEPRGPLLGKAIDTFTELSRRLAPGAVVWRYDPLLLGPAFPLDGHLRRFDGIASRLEGLTRRVVISLVDMYRKTELRMRKAMPQQPLMQDPFAHPKLCSFLTDLAAIAASRGMVLEACAEPGLERMGIRATKCIDDRLLRELFGGSWTAKKDSGQRADCGCVASRDIGVPDSCLFGCLYCYATRSDAVARRRRAVHDPRSQALWSPED